MSDYPGIKAVFSLKEKRSIVKSILNRLPQKFNVAVAEVDQQDVWGTAVIGLVTVGNDAAHLHSQLQKAVTWLKPTARMCQLPIMKLRFYPETNVDGNW
ncbi:MAG: DUF503 domain-containing protein [Ardenticatenaceae bacterium]|nr:DUF503 domain-containing protein [Ardenticatenaceae bacterium]